MADTATATDARGTAQTSGVPGYRAGTWDIDTVHSDVSFSARHMMVAKVKGSFSRFEGTVVTAENPLDSSVKATIDVTSVDTRNPDRDAHLRSGDFLEVDKFPTMTFASTGIRPEGEGYVLSGVLTLHGVTRPVDLELELNGFGPDAYGGYRAGFTASTEINRSDFGISISMPMDGGGVVVSDKIHIALEIEAVLQRESQGETA